MQPSLWGKMLADLLQYATRLGVLVALGAACGCSLNPQPLPPGEAAEGGGANGPADATTQGGDSGSFGSGDAGARVDASEDSPAAVPGTDAGDSGSDGIGDGSSDGGFDGPYDGPSDGGSEDGE
jgi:hypothetical protein